MELENFNPETYKLDTKKLKPEDEWVLSRVNNLVQQVTHAFESYQFPTVPNLLRTFLIEDLSRWYIKLIRNRTWVSAKGPDKLVTFKVLYETFKKFLVLSTPVIPFHAEQIYQNVIRPLNKKLPESVHMLDWPVAERKMIGSKIETYMDIARGIVETARFAREDAKVKLRWPLKALSVTDGGDVKCAIEKFGHVIKEQANVKSVKSGKIKGIEKEFAFGKLYLDTEITPDILEEALVREIMRHYLMR